MSTEKHVVPCKVGKTEFAVELRAENNEIIGCWMLGPRKVTADADKPKGVLGKAAVQLKNYFAGKTHSLDLPLKLKGTDFQQTVWEAARSIPPGETRSYMWLAQKVGNPRAVRAVASALGANPALLFVPCHRVLRSNGDLGGFSCGLEYKELLLQHEKAATSV